MPKVALGEVMTAGAVGVVEESSNDGFSKGDRVSGMFNFQKYWQVRGGSMFSPFICVIFSLSLYTLHSLDDDNGRHCQENVSCVRYRLMRLLL